MSTFSRHSTATADSSDLTNLLREENRKLKEQNEQLQSELKQARTAPVPPPPPPPVFQPGRQTAAAPVYTEPVKSNTSRKVWPIALAAIAGLAILFFVVRANRNSHAGVDTTDSTTFVSGTESPLPTTENDKPNKPEKDTVVIREQLPGTDNPQPVTQDQPEQTPTEQADDQPQEQEDHTPLKVGTHYRVNAARAYFHNQPDRNSRRDAYLTPSDEIMTAVDEEGDFVYIVFTNDQGVTSKGWVLKRDLSPAD